MAQCLLCPRHTAAIWRHSVQYKLHLEHVQSLSVCLSNHKVTAATLISSAAVKPVNSDRY